MPLQVCGETEVFGDVIVPEPSAHLGGGATEVNLEGVFHSPLGEKLPFFGPWCVAASPYCTWMSNVCSITVGGLFFQGRNNFAASKALAAASTKAEFASMPPIHVFNLLASNTS